MKKHCFKLGLVAAFLLAGIGQSRAQDTITICKDVRNIIFSITTISGQAVAWQWTLTGTPFAGKTTDSVCGPVPYHTVGIFSANCLVTFSNGKDSLHKFVIVVFDGTVKMPQLTDTMICGQVSLTLDAGNGSNPLVNYKWSPGGQKTQTISVSAAGTYGVSVYTTDDYSYNCSGCLACDSQTKQINVTLGAKATVDLGPDRFICGDNAVTLDAGPGMAAYAWQPNNETTETISVLISGLYTITVTNSDGCKATDQIFLKDSCPMYIFIPNAITPDDNGTNDVFHWVGNMRMKTFHLKIYNRWGEKMFQTEDPQQGWDGTYQKIAAIPGVYCYLLECVDTNEVRHVFRGNITLLK